MVETREDTRRDGPCHPRTKSHDAAMNSVYSHTPRLHKKIKLPSTLRTIEVDAIAKPTGRWPSVVITIYGNSEVAKGRTPNLQIRARVMWQAR